MNLDFVVFNCNCHMDDYTIKKCACSDDCNNHPNRDRNAHSREHRFADAQPDGYPGRHRDADNCADEHANGDKYGREHANGYQHIDVNQHANGDASAAHRHANQRPISDTIAATEFCYHSDNLCRFCAELRHTGQYLCK